LGIAGITLSFFLVIFFHPKRLISLLQCRGCIADICIEKIYAYVNVGTSGSVKHPQRGSEVETIFLAPA
jgi:hypothetical protein